MTASARAWIMDVGDGWHTAAGAHHVVEYLFSPQTVRLPLTPAHCPGVLIWRGQMVPMIDLVPLLQGAAPEADARTRAVILAYQLAPGEPLRYGALRVQGAPVEVSASDDTACPLPVEPAAFRHFSRSCFAYRDRPVPVLDVTRLFTRALPEPPPNREPDATGPSAGVVAVAAATDEPGATEGPVFAPESHPAVFTPPPAPIAAASDDDEHALQPIIAWDTFTPIASAPDTTAGVDPAAFPLQPDRAPEPCAAGPEPVPPAAPSTSAVPAPAASDELECIMRTVATHEWFEAIAPAVERIDPRAFPMMPDLAQEPYTAEPEANLPDPLQSPEWLSAEPVVPAPAAVLAAPSAAPAFRDSLARRRALQHHRPEQRHGLPWPALAASGTALALVAAWLYFSLADPVPTPDTPRQPAPAVHDVAPEKIAPQLAPAAPVRPPN